MCCKWIYVYHPYQDNVINRRVCSGAVDSVDRKEKCAISPQCWITRKKEVAATASHQHEKWSNYCNKMPLLLRMVNKFLCTLWIIHYATAAEWDLMCTRCTYADHFSSTIKTKPWSSEMIYTSANWEFIFSRFFSFFFSLFFNYLLDFCCCCCCCVLFWF